jgi:hypothetical protein
MDDCQIFKKIFHWMVGTFSVTTIFTSFLWLDDFYHFFYILSLWMDEFYHFFYILSLWMITTFSASSNGQSPPFLHSLPYGSLPHTWQRKNQNKLVWPQQNGFSPEFLHSLLAERDW